MIFPFSSLRMMLLYRPMISMVKVRVTWSPSSFRVSKSKCSSRSASGWRMPVSLAPWSFFRSSMHSIGGCLGFSRGMEVKCTRAELARAENSTLKAASLVRKATTSSSRLGWWILSTRPPRSFSSSSFLMCRRKQPSNAIAS